ncbi:MAG: hypothetical protein QXK85_03805 [Thermofilum sp.]
MHSEAMAVIKAERGVWGPYHGSIYYLHGTWLFVHIDGEVILAARTLRELWEYMVRNGYIDYDELKSFLLVGKYLAYLDDPSLEAAEEERMELARTPPEKVMCLEHGPDEPVVTLDRVPLALLERFMRGELTAKEVAEILGLV